MSVFQPDTDTVGVALEDGVAVITLNRPEARNALSPDLTRTLALSLEWVRDDDAVRALLLTGAGKAFCSGGDVKAMGRRADPDAPRTTHEQAFRELQARHRAIGGALRALRKPTIAALPGAAAGAGMAIALACDLRIAADTAFLSTGYARIGFSGDYGIAWLLTRVVGPARARELMLLCERVDANRALTLGLVNEVTSAETLAEHALSRARQLASGPTLAFAYIKDNLDEALDIDHWTAIDREADRLLKTRDTQDHKEAVRAFAEKREPRFEGR